MDPPPKNGLIISFRSFGKYGVIHFRALVLPPGYLKSDFKLPRFLFLCYHEFSYFLINIRKPSALPETYPGQSKTNSASLNLLSWKLKVLVFALTFACTTVSV